MELEIDHDSVRRNPYGGSLTCHVRNLSMLGRNKFKESNTIEIADLKWKLALSRGFRASSSQEMLHIFLFSCNKDVIHADVGLTMCEGEAVRVDAAIKNKTACAYHYMVKEEILISELSAFGEGTSYSDTLIIMVDLKNITVDAGNQQIKARRNMHTTTLEIIDRLSISRNLNQGIESKMVSPTRNRDSDMCSGSLVRLWANRNADCRYWLCERCRDGNLIIKECLNKAHFSKSFKDFCVSLPDGSAWVTVFKEEKESNGSFQPKDDNSLFVFCVLWDPAGKDAIFLGHLLLQKDMKVYKLSSKIAEMASEPDADNLRLLLDSQESTVDVFSTGKETLGDLGANPGSVLILVKLLDGEEFDFQTLRDQLNLNKQTLVENDEEPEDLKDTSQNDIISSSSTTHLCALVKNEEHEMTTDTILPDPTEDLITKDQKSGVGSPVCQNPDSVVHKQSRHEVQNTKTGIRHEQSLAGGPTAEDSSGQNDEEKQRPDEQKSNVVDGIETPHLTDEATRPEPGQAEPSIDLPPVVANETVSGPQTKQEGENVPSKTSFENQTTGTAEAHGNKTEETYSKPVIDAQRKKKDVVLQPTPGMYKSNDLDAGFDSSAHSQDQNTETKQISRRPNRSCSASIKNFILDQARGSFPCLGFFGPRSCKKLH